MTWQFFLSKYVIMLMYEYYLHLHSNKKSYIQALLEMLYRKIRNYIGNISNRKYIENVFKSIYW